jgi:DNA-nicking Smr family endonuclease
MAGGSRRGSSSSGDPPSFADLADQIDDLEPLDPGPGTPPQATRPPPGDPAKPQASPGAGGAGLHFPNPDEPLLGWTPGVRRRTLNALKRGHLEFQGKIDLHGRDLSSARRKVLKALPRAQKAGLSCVLLVPGRGLHSADGVARLREALPGWLNSPELGGVVIACAPAQPRDGGRGAAYVLLA